MSFWAILALSQWPISGRRVAGNSSPALEDWGRSAPAPPLGARRPRRRSRPSQRCKPSHRRIRASPPLSLSRCRTQSCRRDARSARRDSAAAAPTSVPRRRRSHLARRRRARCRAHQSRLGRLGNRSHRFRRLRHLRHRRPVSEQPRSVTFASSAASAMLDPPGFPPRPPLPPHPPQPPPPPAIEELVAPPAPPPPTPGPPRRGPIAAGVSRPSQAWGRASRWPTAQRRRHRQARRAPLRRRCSRSSRRHRSDRRRRRAGRGPRCRRSHCILRTAAVTALVVMTPSGQVTGDRSARIGAANMAAAPDPRVHLVAQRLSPFVGALASTGGHVHAVEYGRGGGDEYGDAGLRADNSIRCGNR